MESPGNNPNFQNRRGARNYSEKIIADEDGLNIHQRYDLVIPEKTVDRIMGPDPVPTIEICAEEI